MTSGGALLPVVLLRIIADLGIDESEGTAAIDAGSLPDGEEIVKFEDYLSQSEMEPAARGCSTQLQKHREVPNITSNHGFESTEHD